MKTNVMKKETKINKCNTCIHWKNKQAELDYCNHTGYCTGQHLKFNTTNGRLLQVKDRGNLPGGEKFMQVQEFESINTSSIPYGKVTPQRYVLATSEDFGCIFHKKEK